MTPFFVIVGCIIAGSFLYKFVFSPEARVKRKLKSQTSTTISLFKDGDYAKIVGSVKSIGPLLVAPLSGRPCIYYHIVITESRNKSSHVVLEERKGDNFLVKDSSGTAYIEIAKTENYIVKDKKYSSSFLRDATPALNSFLESRGQRSTGIFGANRALSYEEGIIEPDETIAVLGYGTRVSADSLNLSGLSGRVLKMESGQEKIYLSDADSVKA